MRRRGMPAELCALIERYCQLGRLLPSEDDDLEVALADPRARAGAQVILSEMVETERRINDFLERHGRPARSREAEQQ